MDVVENDKWRLLPDSAAGVTFLQRHHVRGVWNSVASETDAVMERLRDLLVEAYPEADAPPEQDSGDGNQEPPTE